MPNQMLFMLLGSLALYVRVSGQPPPPVASNCTTTAQRDALTQFYNLAGGPSWTNSSQWTSNTAPCFYPNIFSSSPPYLVLLVWSRLLHIDHLHPGHHHIVSTLPLTRCRHAAMRRVDMTQSTLVHGSLLLHA